MYVDVPLYSSPYIAQKYISFCNTSQNPYPFNVTHKDFVGLFIYIFSKTLFFFFFLFSISYLLAQTSALYCLLWCQFGVNHYLASSTFIKICYMFDVDFGVCGFFFWDAKNIRKCYLHSTNIYSLFETTIETNYTKNLFLYPLKT